LTVRSGDFARGLEYSVDDFVEAVDKALIARLRHAIAVEEADDERQLNGVLRMLEAAVPDKEQFSPSAAGGPEPNHASSS
jgi:hypothetical protein